MINNPQRKSKTYIEDVDTIEWLTKNVPKQKESEFIRTAVAREIKRVDKKAAGK